MIVRFVLGWRHEADRAEQTAMVEPIDPSQRGEFNGLQALPPIAPSNHLRLVQANHRFRHRIVVRVAATADRRRDAGMAMRPDFVSLGPIFSKAPDCPEKVRRR